MHLKLRALIIINLRVRKLMSVHCFCEKSRYIVNLRHRLLDLFFRKKCSKAEKSELVEKILKLISGHSHEVSILLLSNWNQNIWIILDTSWLLSINYYSIINYIKIDEISANLYTISIIIFRLFSNMTQVVWFKLVLNLAL